MRPFRSRRPGQKFIVPLDFKAEQWPATWVPTRLGQVVGLEFDQAMVMTNPPIGLEWDGMQAVEILQMSENTFEIHFSFEPPPDSAFTLPINCPNFRTFTGGFALAQIIQV